jgi:hypothetical protein
MLSMTWFQQVCIACSLAQATRGVTITLGRSRIGQNG